MINRNPALTKADFLTALVEKMKSQRVLNINILAHPGKREQGKSFNRREQMRRNKATYGKRQICIVLGQTEIVINRSYHMPPNERKIEKKPMNYLESYRASLLTSGYVLLEGSPNSLIFQYEGRIY